MSPKKKREPAYLRKQGKRAAVEKKQKNITFSFSKHIKAEGQTIKEWEDLKLLGLLLERIKNLGQYSALQVRQKKWIKEYHKVNFPLGSGFTEPKHIFDVTWAVMHVTPKSKEVVIGYIKDEVFYIVFLDKDHLFWPSKK